MSVVDFIYDTNPWLEGKPLRYAFRRLEFYRLLRSLERERESTAFVLVGTRRTGKTVILQQLAEFLTRMGEEAVYVQVEEASLRFGDNAVLKVVEGWLSHRSARSSVVMLDEVQHDPRWALQAKVLIERARSRGDRLMFVCSGSSALGTLVGASESLGGRARIHRIYPMGLLEIYGLTRNLDVFRGAYEGVKRAINLLSSGDVAGSYSALRDVLGRAVKESAGLLDDMLIYGGLPETYSMLVRGLRNDEVRSRLIELVELIILKDVVRLQKLYPSRYEISPEEALKVFRIIASRSPRLSTLAGISSDSGVYIKKVELALQLLQYSGLIGIAKQFAKSPEVSERKRLFKAFVADVGLRNAYKLMLGRKLLSNEQEMGSVFENLLLIQGLKLTHLAGSPNPEVFFWRVKRGGYEYEVDAVVKLGKLFGLEAKRGKKAARSLARFADYIESAETLRLSLEELGENIVLLLL